MRCTRAQQWMIAAIDGDLVPRRRRRLEQHLAACAACRAEMGHTERLLGQLAALPTETEVPVRLEWDTLRRVRLEAAEGQGRRVPRLPWITVPAFAMAAVVALVVGVFVRGDTPRAPTRTAALHEPAPGQVAEPRGARPAVAKGEPVPAVSSPVPAELAGRLDLFVDLPMLRQMEKLEHFDAIVTTTVDDEDGGASGSPPSNG